MLAASVSPVPLAAAEPLAIVRQPVGATNIVGDSVVLTVAVTGSPVFYQWWKDGIAVGGATNSSHAISLGSVGLSGDYFVVATNAISSVTSSVARVLFLPDLVGPRALSASVRLDIGTTNNIDLLFDENIQPGTVAITNFSVVCLRTGATIPITSLVPSGRSARIRVEATDDWKHFDDYAVVISGLRDARGNTMAPGTRVPLGWPVTLNGLIHPGTIWRFHNSAIFEPNVYDEDWAGTNYVESDLWGTGAGVFQRVFWGFDSCLGWFGPDSSSGLDWGVNIGFQPEPFLFRTTFHWSATNGPNATLRPRFVADDGAVFFLNGLEIYRYNTAPGPITSATVAQSKIVVPACITNINIPVTNLVGGINHLAVALPQAPRNIGEGDACFGLSLDARYLQTPVLPTAPVPSVALTRLATDHFQLSWEVGGYALEAATNVDQSLSYPRGPWTEVSNMANPFLLQTTHQPAQFYRLKQK